jgi:hypothetical protein
MKSDVNSILRKGNLKVGILSRGTLARYGDFNSLMQAGQFVQGY